MINIYTTDSNRKFKELKNLQKGCWIDLINPSNEEINDISEKTNTDLDLLMKLTDDEELPRIEVGDNEELEATSLENIEQDIIMFMIR